MKTNEEAPRLQAQTEGQKDQLGGGSVPILAHGVPPRVQADADYARAAANRERARWHITLGAIRAHLDEQPSRRARWAAAKRWCAAIAQMAEEGTR